MQGSLDDFEETSHHGDHKSQLKSMRDTVDMWLSLLPEVLDSSEESVLGHTSLRRFLGDEVKKGKRFLASVRDDLTSVT